MTYVWEHSTAAGGDLLVLLAIADHASDDGTNAWPSLARLARKCRMSERNVRRCIRNLEESGDLITHQNAGGGWSSRGDRRPNNYTVVMRLDGGTDCPADAPTGGQIVPNGGTSATERGDVGVRLTIKEPLENHPGVGDSLGSEGHAFGGPRCLICNDTGWSGEDSQGRVIRCKCKPRLKAVGE